MSAGRRALQAIRETCENCGFNTRPCVQVECRFYEFGQEIKRPKTGEIVRLLPAGAVIRAIPFKGV